MNAVGDTAHRQEREELADQHKKRIARRMRNAEEVRRENEQPVILESDRTRHRHRIHSQKRGSDKRCRRPVGARQRAGNRQDHGLGARGPQVHEAVVKKFHSEAMSAPARPASQ